MMIRSQYGMTTPDYLIWRGKVKTIYADMLWKPHTAGGASYWLACKWAFSMLCGLGICHAFTIMSMNHLELRVNQH